MRIIFIVHESIVNIITKIFDGLGHKMNIKSQILLNSSLKKLNSKKKERIIQNNDFY